MTKRLSRSWRFFSHLSRKRQSVRHNLGAPSVLFQSTARFALMAWYKRVASDLCDVCIRAACQSMHFKRTALNLEIAYSFALVVRFYGLDPPLALHSCGCVVRCFRVTRTCSQESFLA